mgnify:CR=1 FL=1
MTSLRLSSVADALGQKGQELEHFIQIHPLTSGENVKSGMGCRTRNVHWLFERSMATLSFLGDQVRILYLWLLINQVEQPDEIIPLGTFCLPALLLGRGSLRRQAYPLDYTFAPLEILSELLATRFAFLLDKNLLVSENAGDPNHGNYTGHVLYGKKMFFHHDLRDSTVYAAFERRVSRILSSLERGCTCVTMINECEVSTESLGGRICSLSNQVKEYNRDNLLIVFVLSAGETDGVHLEFRKPGLFVFRISSCQTREDGSRHITDGQDFYSEQLAAKVIKILHLFTSNSHTGAIYRWLLTVTRRVTDKIVSALNKVTPLN